MRKPLKFVGFTALFFTAVILVACSSKDTSLTDNPSKAEANYSTYQSDGLSLSYPSSWSFHFDESPSLYVERAIGLKASEVARIKVYISKTESFSTKKLVDTLLKDLQLEKSEGVSNFKREAITVGSYQGEVLKWTHTSFGSSNFELSILKVLSAPKDVFVLFEFSDEDISNESNHREHFLNSISYKLRNDT